MLMQMNLKTVLIRQSTNHNFELDSHGLGYSFVLIFSSVFACMVRGNSFHRDHTHYTQHVTSKYLKEILIILK